MTEPAKDHAGQVRTVTFKDSGRADAVVRAVADVLEAKRDAIELDPSISTLTLIVHLDRGPEPAVVYRTESRARR